MSSVEAARSERETCPECYPHKAHLPHVCQRDTCDCSDAPDDGAYMGVTTALPNEVIEALDGAVSEVRRGMAGNLTTHATDSAIETLCELVDRLGGREPQ